MDAFLSESDNLEFVSFSISFLLVFATIRIERNALSVFYPLECPSTAAFLRTRDASPVSPDLLVLRSHSKIGLLEPVNGTKTL